MAKDQWLIHLIVNSCWSILLVPIMIDGHNLVGRLSRLSLEDPDDEEMLVRMLQPYQARSGKKIIIVFDSGEGQTLSGIRQLGGIEAVFAPSGSSADAIIIRRIRQSQNPASWLLITSDRELADKAARLGARIQSANDLAGQLEAQDDESPDWRESPLSPEDVESWLALFGKQD